MEQQPSPFGGWRGLAVSTLAGAGLGAAAKYADQSTLPYLGDIGTYFGFWVLVVTVVGTTSPSRPTAVVRASLAMASMVAAYYVATYVYFGVVPVRDLVVWGTVALTGVPSLAAIVWPARRKGWDAAVALAVPVGLLVAEALTLRHYLVRGLHLGPLAFDLVAAVLLLWLLPPTWAQRLRSAVMVLPVALVGAWVISIGFGYAAGFLMRAVV